VEAPAARGGRRVRVLRPVLLADGGERGRGQGAGPRAEPAEDDAAVVVLRELRGMRSSVLAMGARLSEQGERWAQLEATPRRHRAADTGDAWRAAARDLGGSPPGARPPRPEKAMGYMAHLLGQIHTATHGKDLGRIRFLSMAGITMAEQFSLDENWQMAWRTLGLAVLQWVDWAQANVTSLRRKYAHARIADDSWMSAEVGAFKDEEVLRKERET